MLPLVSVLRKPKQDAWMDGLIEGLKRRDYTNMKPWMQEIFRNMKYELWELNEQTGEMEFKGIVP